MTKLENTYSLGAGFHAHLRDDGSLLITGKWAEDTLLLEKQSVDRLRQIIKDAKR